jgi:spermidine/putrescine-binding protein
MHPFWRSIRHYIVLLLALVLPLIGASRSQAQDDTLVVATWGGAYTDAFRDAFADPFSEETGGGVQIVDALQRDAGSAGRGRQCHLGSHRPR